MKEELDRMRIENKKLKVQTDQLTNGDRAMYREFVDKYKFSQIETSNEVRNAHVKRHEGESYTSPMVQRKIPIIANNQMRVQSSQVS